MTMCLLIWIALTSLKFSEQNVVRISARYFMAQVFDAVVIQDEKTIFPFPFTLNGI